MVLQRGRSIPQADSAQTLDTCSHPRISSRACHSTVRAHKTAAGPLRHAILSTRMIAGGQWCAGSACHSSSIYQLQLLGCKPPIAAISSAHQVPSRHCGAGQHDHSGPAVKRQALSSVIFFLKNHISEKEVLVAESYCCAVSGPSLRLRTYLILRDIQPLVILILMLVRHSKSTE